MIFSFSLLNLISTHALFIADQPVDTARHTQVQVHHESTSPVDTLKDLHHLNPNTVHCALHVGHCSQQSYCCVQETLFIRAIRAAAPCTLFSLSFRCTAHPAICACLLSSRLLKKARPLLALLALSHGLSLLHLRVPHRRPNSACRARSRPSRGAVPSSLAIVTVATPLPAGAPQLLNSERSVPGKEREQGEEGVYPSKRIIRGPFC
jgi:hypothetical protein